MMMGAMVKTYYAEKAGIKPEDIVMVSVMPCTAKKAEARRAELSHHNLRDVDYVISTRELGRMIRYYGIDFENIEESDFDNLMGESTGAGTIFGTTGGVIEAAVRTAYEMLTGKELENVDFKELRGLEGIRSATIQIGDKDFHIGIAHGLGNARRLLEEVEKDQSKYDAIEIMACPGGCVGGAGQPYHHGNSQVIKKRQEALYEIDKNKPIRMSHKNPMIKEIYNDFLGEVYGTRAHELLHTTYTPREKI